MQNLFRQRNFFQDFQPNNRDLSVKIKQSNFYFSKQNLLLRIYESCRTVRKLFYGFTFIYEIK